jgi:hypothetical protein
MPVLGGKRGPEDADRLIDPKKIKRNYGLENP